MTWRHPLGIFLSSFGGSLAVFSGLVIPAMLTGPRPAVQWVELAVALVMLASGLCLLYADAARAKARR